MYYLPVQPMPDVFSSGRVCLPTLYTTFPVLRQIFIRERIEIVHGHQVRLELAWVPVTPCRPFLCCVMKRCFTLGRWG